MSSFVSKSVKPRKDGYGNRHVITCLDCDGVVFDVDPGNSAGVRYAEHYAREAMAAHVCLRPQHRGQPGA